MKRPREHVLEDKSRNYVATLVTNLGWIYRDRPKDYGVDAELEIMRGGRSTGQFVWAQLKAISHLKKQSHNIALRCDVEHLRYWLRLPVPMILIVYTPEPESAYWVWLQAYVANVLDRANPRWFEQTYASIQVPITSALASTVKKLAQLPAAFRALTRAGHWTGWSGGDPGSGASEALAVKLARRPTWSIVKGLALRLNSIERGILEIRNTRIVRRHFEEFVGAEMHREFGFANAAGLAYAMSSEKLRRRFSTMPLPKNTLVITISDQLRHVRFVADNDSWAVQKPERLLDCSCRYTERLACPLHSHVPPGTFKELWQRPVELRHLGTRVLYQGAPKYPAAWPPSLETLKFGTVIHGLRGPIGGTVLDVGCGTGYLGLLAGRLLGCREVTFLDWMPSALAITAVNVARNMARCKGNGFKAQFVCADGIKSLRDRGQHFDLLVCNPPFLPDLGVAELRTKHTVFGTDLLEEVLDFATEVADRSLVAFSSLVLPEVGRRLRALGPRALLVNPDGFEMPFSVNYALDNREYLSRLREQARVVEHPERRHRFYHHVYFVEIR